MPLAAAHAWAATLDPLAPAALDHLIQRSLTKNPGDRWQGVRDVAADLRWIAASRPAAAVGDSARCGIAAATAASAFWRRPANAAAARRLPQRPSPTPGVAAVRKRIDRQGAAIRHAARRAAGRRARGGRSSRHDRRPDALRRHANGHRGTSFLDHFSASSDGQQFLLKLPVDGREESLMTVVVNWPSEFGKTSR
jgi:hypothetical protein